MCIKGQQKLFVMNMKTNEIFTVDNWSVSDNVLKAQKPRIYTNRIRMVLQ